MGEAAEDDDVQPGDMVADQQCRWPRPVAGDRYPDAEDVGEAVVPPGGDNGMGTQDAARVPVQNERREQQAEKHVPRQHQTAPYDPDCSHGSALHDTVEEVSRIGGIDLFHVDQHQYVRTVESRIVTGLATGAGAEAEVGLEQWRQWRRDRVL